MYYQFNLINNMSFILIKNTLIDMTINNPIFIFSLITVIWFIPGIIVRSINEKKKQVKMKKIQADTNVGGKDLWQPIRFVITGQIHGPDLSSFISIIGIDECIIRFNNAKL